MSKSKIARRPQGSKRERDMRKVLAVYAATTGTLVVQTEESERESA
jgi:hypothetical protein